MKKLIGAMMLAAFTATSAFGGSVEFNPSSTLVDPGGQATFDVSVSSETIGNWDATSLLFGTDSSSLTVSDFVFSTNMTDIQAFPPFVTPNTDVYSSGLLAGIFLLEGVNNMTVGTLTVDVAGDAVPESVHTVMVDSGRDNDLSNIASGLNQEGLQGTGTITITPEPATLGLLGLGGLAVLRRRKA